MLLMHKGMLVLFKRFKFLTTILRTLDNQRVIIPNGLLSNGCVKNLFIEKTRRVDMTFGISYGDDVLAAKASVTRSDGC